jgi:hypothetical protein
MLKSENFGIISEKIRYICIRFCETLLQDIFYLFFNTYFFIFMKVHGFVGFKESEQIMLTLADITLELRYTAQEKAAEEDSVPPCQSKILFCA